MVPVRFAQRRIDRGVIQRKNLRREFVSEAELMGQLREQGIERVDEVRKCYVESDGQISVIKLKAAENRGKRPV